MQCAAHCGEEKLCLLVTFVVLLSFLYLLASEIPTFLCILLQKSPNPAPESNPVCPWSHGELNLRHQPPQCMEEESHRWLQFPINTPHRNCPMTLPGQLFTDATDVTNRPFIIFSSAPLFYRSLFKCYKLWENNIMPNKLNKFLISLNMTLRGYYYPFWGGFQFWKENILPL